MEKVIYIYKPKSTTCVQLINQFKQQNPNYKEVKIGYAGRLDPMAHGVMILLVGEENKNREQYLNLDKTYEFEIVFGVQTDTYDFLGLLQKNEYHPPPIDLKSTIEQFVQKNLGQQIQLYPPFATKTVQGKPLFKWAREGKLNEIEIPTRQICIYSLELVDIRTLHIKDLYNYIVQSINLLKGDFRQHETLQSWQDFFVKYPDLQLTTAKLKISCSSGTYVRQLVNRLGNHLDCGALAIDIFRTQVGKMLLDDFIPL